MIDVMDKGVTYPCGQLGLSLSLSIINDMVAQHFHCRRHFHCSIQAVLCNGPKLRKECEENSYRTLSRILILQNMEDRGVVYILTIN